MNHKLDNAHKLIQEELMRISSKCDRIELKCEEVGAASTSTLVQYPAVTLPSIPLQVYTEGIKTDNNTSQIITGTRCPVRDVTNKSHLLKLQF